MYRGKCRMELEQAASFDYQHGRPVESVPLKSSSYENDLPGQHHRDGSRFPGDLREAISNLHTRDPHRDDIRSVVEEPYQDSRDSSVGYQRDFNIPMEIGYQRQGADLRNAISRPSREVVEMGSSLGSSSLKESVERKYENDLRNMISGSSSRDFKDVYVGSGGREGTSTDKLGNDLRDALKRATQKNVNHKPLSYPMDLEDKEKRKFRDDGRDFGKREVVIEHAGGRYYPGPSNRMIDIGHGKEPSGGKHAMVSSSLPLKEEDLAFLAETLKTNVDPKLGWSKGPNFFTESSASSPVPDFKKTYQQSKANIPQATSYILDSTLMMNVSSAPSSISSASIKPHTVASIAGSPQLIQASSIGVNLQPNLYGRNDLMLLNSIQNRGHQSVVSLAPVVMSAPLQIVEAASMKKGAVGASFWDTIKSEGLLSYEQSNVRMAVDIEDLGATHDVGEDFQIPSVPKKRTGDELEHTRSSSPSRKLQSSGRRVFVDSRKSPVPKKTYRRSVSPRSRFDLLKERTSKVPAVRERSPRHSGIPTRKESISPRRERIKSRTPPARESNYGRGNLQERSWHSRERSPRLVRDRSPRLGRERSPHFGRERSPGLVRDRSPPMVRERSPRMVRERSPRMVRERSPQMVRVRSPQMSRERSPRMVRERSPRIVRERSPRMGRSRSRSPRKLRERSPQWQRKNSFERSRERSPRARERSPWMERDLSPRNRIERPQMERARSPGRFRERSPRMGRDISPLGGNDRPRMRRDISPLGGNDRPRMRRETSPHSYPRQRREISPQHMREGGRGGPRFSDERSPGLVCGHSRERSPGVSRYPQGKFREDDRMRNRDELSLRHSPGKSGAMVRYSRSPESHRYYRGRSTSYSPVPVRVLSPERYPGKGSRSSSPVPVRIIPSNHVSRYPMDDIHQRLLHVATARYPMTNSYPRGQKRKRIRRQRIRNRPSINRISQPFGGRSQSPFLRDINSPPHDLEASSQATSGSPQVARRGSPEEDRESPRRSWDTRKQHKQKQSEKHEAGEYEFSSGEKIDKDVANENKDTPMEDQRNSPFDFAREASPISVGSNDDEEFGSGVVDGSESPLFDQVSLSPKSFKAASPGTPTSDERQKPLLEDELQRACSPVSLSELPVDKISEGDKAIDFQRDLSPVSVEEGLEGNAEEGPCVSPLSAVSRRSSVASDDRGSTKHSVEKDGEDLRVQILRMREEKVELKLKKLEEEIETELRLQNLSPDILDYSPQRDTPSPLLDECDDEGRSESYSGDFRGFQ